MVALLCAITLVLVATVATPSLAQTSGHGHRSGGSISIHGGHGGIGIHYGSLHRGHRGHHQVHQGYSGHHGYRSSARGYYSGHHGYHSSPRGYYSGRHGNHSVHPGYYGGLALRALRGGSWYANPDRLQSAFRGRGNPADGYDHVGFRCAQDIPK